ncbi:MAG: helix-hairpin-helix domain-containing protein [Anaerolineae bacterium]|nr:helix-hairpin-helix domain-containing protein [Anaerolineae bacterium]
MNVQRTPDTHEKLQLLGQATRFEPAGDAPETEGRYQSRSLAECIAHLHTPHGAKPVLKGMLTTACEKNCFYCPFRAGRGKMRRLTFRPQELATAFDRMQRAKQVDGLFLSSGIIRGGVTTQDKLIDTADIIRRRQGYRGYIHLKMMPGSEYDQIVQAMRLADRVSINLEAPTADRLHALAPGKDLHGDLLQRLRWAHDIRQRYGLRTSLVTQFVVGAVGDTDVELLTLTAQLYRQMHLARTYFSAFHPIVQTPLENTPPADPLREFRLYQASFLLRDYAWDVEDLSFAGGGNLRTDVDPKRAWAEVHLRQQPVDVMQAPRELLLRVPGIGPRTAGAIIQARRERHLRDLAQLKALGLRAPQQAAPFIRLAGGQRPPQQLTLW